ncbi:MAG TPA: nitroreductase/quinone reductase family protein [Candidatus Binatia bacterium]
MAQTIGTPLHFIPPGSIARVVNRVYGSLTRLGLSMPYSFLLSVPGRRTGKTCSVPVNLLQHDGKLFLVATRGHTQWARNARASRKIFLTRGRLRLGVSLREIPDNQKAAVLQSYLTRFNWMAWRFFPVRAGSPLATFEPIAACYPVFELIRMRPENPRESPPSQE